MTTGREPPTLPGRIQDRNIWVIYAAMTLLGIAYGTSIAVLAVHLDESGIPKLAMGGLASIAKGAKVPARARRFAPWMCF